VVYLSALSRDEIAFAANDRVAVAAAEKIMGNTGTIIMAVLVMISTFGCINGLVLSGARVFRQWLKTDYFLAQLLKITKIMFPRSLYGYREFGLHYCALAGNMEISWI
jgi:APA family basic amino acid/polyamine antiporter